MKKILIITGMILVLGLTAAGSFWGGMQYQSKLSEQTRTDFFTARGGQVPGSQQANQGVGFPGGAASGGQAPAGFGGGGTSGVIKSIARDVMTLSTATDVTTVNLTDNTPVEKNASGSISDLQPGMRVMVTGQADANGVITASRVMIVGTNSASPAGNAYPPAAGTEP